MCVILPNTDGAVLEIRGRMRILMFVESGHGILHDLELPVRHSDSLLAVSLRCLT